MTTIEGIYCLDTSALLFMADRYSSDIFPEVWELLTELAASEAIIAPREVRRELERKEDNGALAWVKANTAMFQVLDAEQCRVARDIISSPQFHGLVDFDAELPDADPFVVALAVKTRDLTGFFGTAPAVVAVDSQEMGTSLESVCEDAGYQIRFLTPHQMLLEIGLDVPNPNRRGLADLYGIWMGMRSTEEDAHDAKIKFRGTEI